MLRGRGAVHAGLLEVVSPSETDDPLLAQLTQWAAERCPITVTDTDDGAFDLDHVEGAEDPQRLPALLAGHDSVRGGAIESDAGVAAALAAGVSTIVARHPLPVMLAALAASRGDDA